MLLRAIDDLTDEGRLDADGAEQGLEITARRLLRCYGGVPMASVTRTSSGAIRRFGIPGTASGLLGRCGDGPQEQR